MIRLRHVFERGRAHPILGPILLVVLVLLLAMVFLHVAHEGFAAAAEIGAICVGIAAALGLLLANRLRLSLPQALVRKRGDRGPPSPVVMYLRPVTVAAFRSSTPLRR